MLKNIGYLAVALLLWGCEKPEIQSLRVSAVEDQPKLISADVKTTGNMTGPSVTLEAVTPTQGTVPNIDMIRGATNGNIAVFNGTAPLTAEYSPLTYGTQWKATVDVPYSVLWQREHVTRSVNFVVGAAHNCSSFDGDLQYQGWSNEAQLRSNPERHPRRTATVNWLANENARASAATGALGMTIADLPDPLGSESWIAAFNVGTAWTHFRSAPGIRLAVKSTSTTNLHVALLINRGLEGGRPGAEVFEWVYSSNRSVPAGNWNVVDLPYPAFPAPVTGTNQVSVTGISINAVGVTNGMQVAIDDVCPMS